MGYDTCGDHGGTNRDGEPCGQPAGAGTDFEDGKCRHHRGTSPDGSSHDGNNFAAKAGAWAEDFYEDFLTEAEQKRVMESAAVLGDDAGAQGIAQHAASVCLEQFRRTGDERFLRRFESICDKAGVFPEEDVNVNVEQSGAVELTITREVVDSDE